jgi:hypothetical protein
MIQKNLDKLILKRVNPFQGLVIDDDIWRDSHDYHRNHQRLHQLAVHGPGIVTGLEISPHDPADLSLVVNPGVGIDNDGNIVVAAKAQPYTIQSKERGTIYITIQFREIPTGPFQPPEGGQPTRILEAYRIQERYGLPDEPYLELARIDFDPARAAISSAANPLQPAGNEIDNRFRMYSEGQVKRELSLWHYSADKNRSLHLSGLANLAREINRTTNYNVTINSVSTLDAPLVNCSLLYFTGKAKFELTKEAKANLATFVRNGGVIFGEGCFQDQQGSREFGIAFNNVMRELGHKLEMINPGHRILQNVHIFGAVPAGSNSRGAMLASPRVIYSDSDYGCAWEGGGGGIALPRESIRDSFEIGTNICLWGH